MRLIFDHTMGFGKMQHETMLYFPFAAVFEKNERSYALENGWFPITNDLWFQTRSTRINLDIYKPSEKVKKIAKKIRYYPDVNMTPEKKKRLEEIYYKYLSHKGFMDRSLTLDDMIANSHGHIYYVYNNKIIAFTFYKIIDDKYLSIEFAWDYEETKLSMGHVTFYYESIYAKTRKCKQIYLSSGYEKCSIYKSGYPGFQWWKGYAWSSDIEQFKQLCIADEQVEIKNFKFT